jgi:ABC-2 type transport system permease protein
VTVPWGRAALAVCALELRIQRRDPAVVLYALVFLLLTFAFVSSGTVDLVRDRGVLPKLSPLAIALALGGLTAFGQVITTMVAATALLRDAADRTDQLLFSTPLSHRSWVSGRWLATVIVVLAVSTALVAGVLLGAAAPWVERDVPWLTVAGRAIRAWALVTLPTTLAIATLLTAVAVRTRRLLGVLAAALALIFLWQGCESVRRRIDGPVATTTAAALLDPFGTVALQATTAPWTTEQRAMAPIPISGLLGWSRLLWLLLAVGAGTVALRPPATRLVRPTAERSRADVFSRRFGSLGAAWWPRAHSRLFTLARFTRRWMWRERGWLVIAGLGALNVAVHAFSAPTGPVGARDAAGLIALVQEHSRLFLILLATIYGGELLWRDVDDRVLELVQSTPVGTATLVGGRVLGVWQGQLLLVCALLVAGWLGTVARPGVSLPSLRTVWESAAYGGLWLFLPFTQWLVLSLLVHVLVGHKVIAHLLLIAGWVLAVTLDANGASSPWVRFADPPALTLNAPVPVAEALGRGAVWTVVSAGLLALTMYRWRAATSRR